MPSNSHGLVRPSLLTMWRTSAVVLATRKGNTDTVRELLECKASVNLIDENWRTPLDHASAKGNIDITRLLITSKANLNKATNMYFRTPLIIAARLNHMTIVRLLVESGADTTIRCIEKKTAAEWAKEEGHDSVAEYLVNDAPCVHAPWLRFHPSARNERGKLCEAKGRAKRAATRDLVDIAGFDRDMMGLLNQFCTGKR